MKLHFRKFKLYKTGMAVLAVLLMLSGCPDPMGDEPPPQTVPDDAPANIPGDESDAQAHIAVDNRTDNSMYLYAGSSLLKTIGARSKIAVRVENEGRPVPLNMWKTSDVPDTANPDLLLLFRSWSPVLSPEDRAAYSCLTDCPLWVIEKDTDKEAGSVNLNYAAETAAGHENIYNADIYLNGRNGSHLVSLSPGTEGRLISLPYGVQTLSYRYWYDDPGDSKPSEEAGWLENHTALVLNAVLTQHTVVVPVYTGSSVGRSGSINIENDTAESIISIGANGYSIEDIVTSSGNSTGLSFIPQGVNIDYELLEGWYTFTAETTGGTHLKQHTAYITHLHQYKWNVNDSIHTLRIQNDTTETVLLHNAADKRYLGVLLKPKEERTVEVAGNVAEFHVLDSDGNTLSIPFTLTDYNENTPLFLPVLAPAPPVLSAGGAPLSDGGTYPVNTQLSITSADTSAKIYYTLLNGDEPTTAAALYTAPVNLGSSPGSVTIKAIAVKHGMVSNVVTAVVNLLGPSKLTASDGASGDQFGSSVAIDGDTAIVGAYWDDDNGNNSGSAYIFTRSGSTWTQQAKLLASDRAVGDYFGRSVAMDGDTAIVGANGDRANTNGYDSGSAYIFTRSGTNWTQQTKLLAPDGDSYDYFGTSVAIDGDTAIVGVHGDDDDGTNSGSAYIFTRSGANWTQQAKLLASDGAVGDQFGVTVAIDGNTAIVGTFDDDNGDSSGSAYIFTRSGSTWTQQAKLLASDGDSYDYFGTSVAIDGDTAIVGANEDNNTNGDSSGSAYIFTRSGSTWTQQAKLLASDGASYDKFGRSIAIDGDTAIVGANEDNNTNGNGSGSAYIFTRSGTNWTQQDKLLASDGTAGDYFGTSVAMDGDTAIVGAYGDNGAYSGCAYIFYLKRE